MSRLLGHPPAPADDHFRLQKTTSGTVTNQLLRVVFATEQNISHAHNYRTTSMSRRWKCQRLSSSGIVLLVIVCTLFVDSRRFFVTAQQENHNQHSVRSRGEASVAAGARFMLLDNATNTTGNTTATVGEDQYATMVNSTNSTEVGGGDSNSTTSAANSTDSGGNQTMTGDSGADGDSHNNSTNITTAIDSSGGDNSTVSSTNETNTSTDTDNSTDANGGDAGNTTSISNGTVPVANTTDAYGCNVTSGEKWCDSLQICFKEWEKICPTSASCTADDDCVLWLGGCGLYGCECFALGVNETGPTECDPDPNGEPCICAGCTPDVCIDVRPACVNMTCALLEANENSTESNTTDISGGNETNSTNNNSTNTTTSGPVVCSEASSCFACLGLEGCDAWTSLGTCLASCSDAPMDDVGCYSTTSLGFVNQTVDQICTQDATDRQNEVLCKKQMNCSACVATTLSGGVNNATCQWFDDIAVCRPTCGMTGCGDFTCSGNSTSNVTVPENNATSVTNETATTNTTNATDPSNGTTSGDDSLLFKRIFGEMEEGSIKLGRKAKLVEFPGGEDGLSLLLLALPRKRVMVTDKLPESRNITLPRNASGLTIECDFRLEKRRRGLLFFSASVEFQISTESESLTKTIQAKRKRIRRTAHLQTQKYQRFIALRSLPEDATIGILLIKYVVTNLSRRSRIQGRKKQRFFLQESRLYEGNERIIQNPVLQQARTDGNVFEHNDDGMHLRKSRTVPPL